MKIKPYFTLLSLNRNDVDMGWIIEFGDYDRQVVEDEEDDFSYSNTGFRTRIIRTADDQASINAAVAALNY